jgi:hypothetical protein
MSNMHAGTWRTLGRSLSLAICLLFSLCAAQGQNVGNTTLVWASSTNTNLQDNATTRYACSFVSLAGKKIEWRQGAEVGTWLVEGTEGSWPNVAQDGTVAYRVSQSGLKGRMVFSRTSGKASVRLTVALNGKTNFDFLFLVDSVVEQP